MVITATSFPQLGFRDSVVLVGTPSVSQTILPRRRLFAYGFGAAAVALLPAAGALSQTIEAKHWHGATAQTRQPEHIVAGTIGEWRSLWSRVGSPAPDIFEPGRMNAVGIFLGRRASEGYAVNFLSASRRRDRIVIVFEELMPAEIMMAQRGSPPPPPAPRPVAGGPAAAGLGGGGNGGFMGFSSGSAGFAPPGASASVAPLPPMPARPVPQPTSPWAIILINRTDLPISVEQRLFR